jgi:glycosyltransferase involved in cell wall biosynthesis
MSLTVLEAMFMGKPVVASDIPSLSAVVRDGQTGFLFPPGEVEVLAERLVRLLSDADLARRLGQAGRELAESEFDLDRMVAKTMALYERLLARGGGRR